MPAKTRAMPLPATGQASFSVALPRGYRPADALRFHGRDKEGVAEALTDTGIRKGVLLANIPATIDIDVATSTKEVTCRIAADAPLTDAMTAEARMICMRMLGLSLDPAHFAKFAADDPHFGALVKRQKGLRVIQSPSIFEALTWAIMGQQINVSFAVSLRRSFIQQGGRQHSSGLWCYPSPQDAARIDLDALTSRQFSNAKAQTLLRLAGLMAEGELDLNISESNPLENITAALLAIKGIGPWTVNYVLLRGYAYADCSLHGDVAVRAAIHRIIGGEKRPDMAAAERFLLDYSPHRTMAAAHLWASLADGDASY